MILLNAEKPQDSLTVLALKNVAARRHDTSEERDG